MNARQRGVTSAEGARSDEERIGELLAHSLEEVEAFLRREDVRSAFDELGSELKLWQRARADLASFLEERGVAIPEGVSVAAREAEGQEDEAEKEAADAGIDIAVLSSAIKRTVGVVEIPTLIAVEATGIKKLVYSCRLVEVCREESDPNIWGGKILWGCRTVCVGSGWTVV